MRIVHYCQHVLGIGHLARSLEIAGALAARADHNVTLVSGGQPFELPLPAGVHLAQLPPLMMTADFSALYPAEPGRDVDDIKAERISQLLGLLTPEPDIFLVELFPFGRNAFRFELLPALKSLAEARKVGRTTVVCSVRDILVEKDDTAKYEARVVERVTKYFDAVAVHADPDVVDLPTTFSRVADLGGRLHYTGYVTPRPSPGTRGELRNELCLGEDEELIVASAGGGAVGGPLLAASLEAFAVLKASRPTVFLRIFAGPYLDNESFARLTQRALQIGSVVLERFSNRFPDWLAAADASISQAGYNTTMNLLAANTPALVLPFAQNREQRLRAERLQARGALEILEESDLAPEVFARRLNALLCRGRSQRQIVDLDGAEATARLLENLHARRTTGAAPGALQ